MTKKKITLPATTITSLDWYKGKDIMRDQAITREKTLSTKHYLLAAIMRANEEKLTDSQIKDMFQTVMGFVYKPSTPEQIIKELYG